MSSFDEKLETLDVTHRFIERDFNAQFRRDSTSARLKQDPHPLFMQKRERLESGESLFFPQLAADKRDLGNSFNLLNSCDKFGRRKTSFNPQPEFNLNYLENTGRKTVEYRPIVEEESVIDQKLTIMKVETVKVSILDTEIGVSDKDESLKEDARFVIKVKMTDQRLEVSNHGSFDNEEDIGEEVDSNIVDEKMNNLIFDDEPSRLVAKVAKIIQYWNRVSLLIPNVFRHLKDFEDDKDNLLEFQDYSRKELLVQSNGTKFKAGNEKSLKKVKKSIDCRVKRVGRDINYDKRG